MWLQWLARIMDRPASEAGPPSDPTQAAAPAEWLAPPCELDIAAAQNAISRFEELAQAPAII